MAFRFVAEQWLPHPLELVFAFFANPENLPRLMPAWQATRIEQAQLVPPPPRPEGSAHYPGALAGDGSVVSISLRPVPLSPLRLHWDARIEDFRWNEGFCDVQTRGPFRSWRHCHTVRRGHDPASGAVGTLVRDLVTYELPLDGVNALADRFVVKNALQYTFRVRQKRTLELLARTGASRFERVPGSRL